MMLNREGTFHAYPSAIGISQTAQSKLLQVVIEYRLIEELANGQWTDCSAENLQITGYHLLEKKDGSLNEININSLKSALDWNGVDPFELQDREQDFCQKAVQLKIGVEEYNGQQKLKVQFINPYGSTRGGVSKADENLRKLVVNRLGSKFRAISGGASVNPPAPPKAPAPTQKGCTQDQAWQKFTAAYQTREGGSEDDMQKQWFSIICQLFPNKAIESLTPADWQTVSDQAPGKIIPF